MSFTSPSFVVFVLAALAAHHAVPRERRWIPLLAASLAFYALAFSSAGRGVAGVAVPGALVAGMVLCAYAAGLWTASARREGAKRAALAIGIVPVVGVLVTMRWWLPEDGSGGAAFIVPLGTSFLALRLIGYVLEVRRGTIVPERHFGLFLLFAIVFPEVPSGPIERAGALIPQLREPAPFRYESFTSGVKLCAWGVFKKLVVADRLRPFVDSAYDAVGSGTGVGLAVATVFFAFQVYCDFSGYSDIAIGLGRLFGLRFARNFDRPYAAASIPEFWSRWHISLSSWLRDYLFLPMAYRAERGFEGSMRRGGAQVAGYSVAAAATMVVCGLWHGARWTYVAWGLSMAVLLTASAATRGWRRGPRRGKRKDAARLSARFSRPVRVMLTFLLVCVTWVFFRAETVSGVLSILQAIPSGVADYAGRVAASVLGRPAADAGLLFPLLVGQTVLDLLIALAGIAAVLVVETPWRGHSLPARLSMSPRWVRWPAYVAVVMVVAVFRASTSGGFIYQGF